MFFYFRLLTLMKQISGNIDHRVQQSLVDFHAVQHLLYSWQLLFCVAFCLCSSGQTLGLSNMNATMMETVGKLCCLIQNFYAILCSN